jgi:hypothetical protein
VHLRGRENILKRLVVHSGAANLGLLMRKLFGKGTPRGIAGVLQTLISAANASTRLLSVPAVLAKTFGDFIRRPSADQLFPSPPENDQFHLALASIAIADPSGS